MSSLTCTSSLANGITCKSRSLTLQNNRKLTVPENLPVSNMTTKMLLPAVNVCKTFAHMSSFAKLLHACQLLQNFCTRVSKLHLDPASEHSASAPQIPLGFIFWICNWQLWIKSGTSSKMVSMNILLNCWRKGLNQQFPSFCKTRDKKNILSLPIGYLSPGPIASSLPTLLTNRRLNPISAPLSKNGLGHLGVKKMQKSTSFGNALPKSVRKKILFNIYSAQCRTGSHSENF